MKFLFAFVCTMVSCTDYELKNVNENTEEGEGTETTPETNGEDPSCEEEGEEEEEGPNNEDPEEEEDEEECSETFINFDIEEVSTLQDAVSYSVAGWSQDAVALNFDDANLGPNQTWRVSAMEILVLISEAHFPHFVDGQEIHIQEYDSSNPNTGNSWTMS